MQERKERARVLAMVSVLIPDGERQDGQHEKHDAHWDSLAAAAQGLITKSATVLAAGTGAPAARFIAAIWDKQTVGASCRGRMPKAPQVQLEVPMPYLFWAVVPFELMKMWWDACERAREASAK
jgi:hypothetical protein